MRLGKAIIFFVIRYMISRTKKEDKHRPNKKICEINVSQPKKHKIF